VTRRLYARAYAMAYTMVCDSCGGATARIMAMDGMRHGHEWNGPWP